MNKRIIHLQIVSLIIITFFLSKEVYAFQCEKILSTDHLVVNYESDEIGYAISLAGKIESFYTSVTSFLEINPPDKLRIFISKEKNINYFLTASNRSRINFFIPSGSNLNIIENEIYNNICRTFLNNITGNNQGVSSVNEIFFKAIAG